jgi:alcohol dehydrogenase, propanol-preferring
VSNNPGDDPMKGNLDHWIPSREGLFMATETIRAARFHGLGEGIRVEDVPYPHPGPGEVAVRVAACGICASDLHFLEGMPVPGGLPLTLGHEPSGVVEELGDGTKTFLPGDRVAVTIGSGCGSCPTCRTGHANSCPSLVAPGLHIDGAYAEVLRVPESTLVSVPDGVSFAAAGVATDCVATPYHGLMCRARLQAGEQVAVFGCGGLGTQTIALAKFFGASDVVAVDVSQAALDHAAFAGATATVLIEPGEDPVPKIMGILGNGVTLAVEAVGIAETASAAARSLTPGGRVLLIGIGMALPPVELPQALFALWEHSLIGTFGSHKEDLEEVLRLDAEGAIDIESCISHRVTLEQVPEGLEMLATKRGDPQRIIMENAELR